MLDNFVISISNPFCLILFRSDAPFNNLSSLRQLACFNIEWAWSKIFEFSNFGDGILEQVGTVCHLQSNNPQI